MIPHQKTCCRVAKLAQIAELEIIERYLCVAFLFRIPQKSVHHHIVLSVGYFTRFLLQFETFFRNRSCCGVQHELRRLHDVGNFVSRFAGQVTSIASEEYHTCTPDFGHAPRVVRLDRPRKADRHGHILIIIRRGIYMPDSKKKSLKKSAKASVF